MSPAPTAARLAATAAVFALAAVPPTARAQVAGSARVALDAASARYDGVPAHNFNLSAAVLPFVGEHWQVGLAPAYGESGASGYPTYRRATVAGYLNYVVGGGGRWRGYAGGYLSGTGATRLPGSSAYGAQAGALYFFEPALALRAEVRSRRQAERGYPWNTTALVVLDPYLFGPASGAPRAAGFGVTDVALFAYRNAYGAYVDRGASATVAPYLARWAQVGVAADVVGSNGGGGAHRLFGFGRAYLPLTARTQPFAEGFAEQTSYNGQSGRGLTDYGGALGVRRMLNARVALDVGVRRTLYRPETFSAGAFQFRYRQPGVTGLVVGLATRIGRTR